MRIGNHNQRDVRIRFYITGSNVLLIARKIDKCKLSVIQNLDKSCRTSPVLNIWITILTDTGHIKMILVFDETYLIVGQTVDHILSFNLLINLSTVEFLL